MKIEFEKVGGYQFPEQTAPDSEKVTFEFGLSVGRAIQSEWFGHNASSSRYFDRQAEFHNRRLFARGEQSNESMKKSIGVVDGDLSHTNLDWTNVPIIPKFVDIVVNGMQNRIMKAKAEAQDALSAERRKEHQDDIEGQMAAKPILEGVQESFGADPFTMPPSELPNSDEELSLHMQLKYKPSIEIAEELSISTVFEMNKYSELRRRFDYDQVVLGMSCGKHMFKYGRGIELEYVDPATVIHAYTEDPNFEDDVFYWGEVKVVPVSELRTYQPDLTDENVKELQQAGGEWATVYGYQNVYQDSLFYKDTVTLLFFNYKTTKKVVHKIKKTANGTLKAIEKDDDFNPPAEMMEEMGFEKVERTDEVWYDGIMVMGTNKIFKWELMENMVRPDSASQGVMSNYIASAPRMYKGVIESLVRRMIPFAELIQLTHLKMQQVVARTVPDGVYIDADGLNEIDLGNGKAYNPQEALNMYFQTGSVIGRSKTRDGEFNHAKIPIQQLVSGSGASKLQVLANSYNHYLEQIADVTGINKARDGSNPDERALVGVQKMASLNSNTATRHVLDSSYTMMKTFAEAITIRISEILEHSDFREEFANQIGKFNLRVLDDIKNLHLHSFGIFIEIAPDEEEKEKLEALVGIALNKENINLEDAIEINAVGNVKLASQLLKVKRRQKDDADTKKALMMQQEQQRGQAMIAKQAQDAKMAELQFTTQIKDASIKAQIEGEKNKLVLEAKLKKDLMNHEFSLQMRLAEQTEKNLHLRDSQKEDRKDKRQDKANTDQSQLIDQRQNDTAPKSFESNEDSLDGFGMEEFMPR